MWFLKQLTEKWANWLGDRDMELSLRRHLSENGFLGHAARFSQLRLVAVQRPGWLQVYTFIVEAHSQINDTDPQQKLFGIVRQDERYERCEIRLFSIQSERAKLLDEWSQDLIRLRRGSTQT